MKLSHAPSISTVTLLTWIVSFAYFAPAATCRAVVRHPVSIVNADIYVDQNRTTVKLTCFAEDLELLQGVEAHEDGRYDSQELRDATRKHVEYLTERVQILDANGEPVTPEVKEIIEFEIPDEGIEAGKLMSYQMAFVLEFKTNEPPDFLTVQQDMVAEGAVLPSEMRILLKQAGSETPYTHLMKPASPQTFRFDWDNPALSPDAPEEDWEEWFADQREKTLGIDSYSSTYSFVYINDHEVRHEVLIPLATLASLIDFDRADRRFLEIEEQETARARIQAWLEVGNPVSINGQVVAPNFDRIDFYGLSLRDFAVQADARRVSMASGRVGVIQSYAADAPPTNVEVTWDMFNHAIRSVDSVIVAYEKTQTTAFSKFLPSNTFTWMAPKPRSMPVITPVAAKIDQRFARAPNWKLSVLSLSMFMLALVPWLLKLVFKITTRRAVSASFVALVAGCVLTWTGQSQSELEPVATVPIPFAARPAFEIDANEADEIFRRLHGNLFDALAYRNESEVYDALAQTVDGDLLRRLYLDLNRSLRIEEQGGAIARVDEVTVFESEPTQLLSGPQSKGANDGKEPMIQFGWRSEWNLSGTVEHWGHVHQRINSYDANFTIAERDGLWKIVDLQMTNNQGQVKTSLRKLEP